ncbi:MAG: helix-turn-helix domain-containing protein [Alkalispirochaeta sp.]
MSNTAVYEPIIPSTDDSRIAKRSSKTLSQYVSRNLSIRVNATNDEIELPEVAVRLLVDILTNMAEGNAVTLIPVHVELTTKQAADILGVSRPFLIRLLEEGKIPFRKVGTHRRVYFKDVQVYKIQIAKERQSVLTQLVEEAQALDVGY